jgi:predicted enzyme related to lactoylglutathione lyase
VDGVTIYLNGGDNLQVILDKVEKSGGRILIPKTLHADESGYFATFIDSEGNKIGLHSPNYIKSNI